MKTKIGLLGCGNMVRAILKGAKDLGEFEFYMYTPSGKSARQLSIDFNSKWIQNLSEMPSCDFYLVGCKPQQFKELAREFVQKVGVLKNFLSIMAAVEESKIIDEMKAASCIRIMPNLPVGGGFGIHLLYSSGQIPAEVLNFLSSGNIFHCSLESQLEHLTYISGCGPGVFFHIFNGFLKAFRAEFEVGASSERLEELFFQMLRGSLEYRFDQPEKTLDQLVDMVCSKGGVTEAMVESIDQNHDIWLNMFKKAQERKKSLG